DEVLSSYKIRVMPGEKLIYNNIDILSFAHSKMNQTELAKSPLSIGVINVHNISCTKFLPLGFKQFIADQIQDCKTTAVYFAERRSIDKFIVDCEEEVLEFLNKFQDIHDLESLAKCLNENAIDMSIASNDLIFVRNLFDHFYFLFKNGTLLEQMSEHEFSAYIWTPLIRNAFLGKDDFKVKLWGIGV
ncbi:8636_t:CDS:1, partial [Paraglomus occultum]